MIAAGDDCYKQRYLSSDPAMCLYINVLMNYALYFTNKILFKLTDDLTPLSIICKYVCLDIKRLFDCANIVDSSEHFEWRIFMK